MDSISCNPADFKNACSRFPSGVTITTVRDEKGLPHGITVSSFTSVSLSPPMVLVCIDHRSSVLQHISPGKHIGVNILGNCQQELSIRFSGDSSKRFTNVPWYPGRMGVPLFLDVAAHLECQVAQMWAAGDHFIILGKVLHANSNEGPSLLYVNRCYRKYADIQASLKL